MCVFLKQREYGNDWARSLVVQTQEEQREHDKMQEKLHRLEEAWLHSPRRRLKDNEDVHSFVDITSKPSDKIPTGKTIDELNSVRNSAQKKFRVKLVCGVLNQECECDQDM